MAKKSKNLLVDIIDTFTIHNIDRILVIDQDCSKLINYGDNVVIKSKSCEEVVAKLLDGFLEDGNKYPGIKSDKVSSLRVSNLDFPANFGFLGSKMYK